MQKSDSGLTDRFWDTYSYSVHKIMEKIEKGGKYTYGDVTMGHGYCDEKALIKLSKHFEMRRVATKYMSHCQNRKYKSGIQRRQHPISLAPYCSDVKSQSPFLLQMEPDKYCLTIKIWEIPYLETFFMCLLTAGWCGQLCYMRDLLLLSNQCCQGTKKITT